MATRKKTTAAPAAPSSAAFEHKGAEALIRPEVGVQSRFKKRKQPAKYAYDPSLAPSMQWDGGNPARERGEALIAAIEAAAQRLAMATEPADRERAQAELREATAALKALSRPFLEWAGKAERLSFEVPTLPLFIHERLSTQAILESLKGFTGGQMALNFGGHPDRDLAEQLLKAYEYPNGWFNRMILGDSLVVMNSLLQYEHMAGQVQMVYIDPPYGVKFGSNFQPFVRKRDVSHGADEDLTREPEMVKAYRDTWELGLHSYLTYLRDRLLVTRDLLTDSGSVFVQISDENLHHVRELLDEVFGWDNSVAVIAFKKTGFAGSDDLSTTHDYLLWYAKDRSRLLVNKAFGERPLTVDELGFYDQIELPDGKRRPLTKEEKLLGDRVRSLGRPFARNPMVSPGWQDSLGFPIEFEGISFRPPPNRHWATSKDGIERLRSANRLARKGNTLRFVRFFDDFALQPLGTVWNDTGVGGFVGDERLYVVQTDARVIERCMLMTTNPGDLVIDPTCGSGTTAYVAEQWGRRWITIDTSRVPLALARQRLLTASFDYQELKNPEMGPAGGFVYKMKQNKKGEHTGGIVPHVTLKSIANGEQPDVEVLVDRPEIVPGVTRVSGPFVFEATIPTAQGFDDASDPAAGQATKADEESDEAFIDRMVGVLQSSPVLHLPGNQTVTLAQVRRPARALWLSAEAVRPAEGLASSIEAADAANGGLALASGDSVAIVFGPAHGSITRRLVEEAWGEAQLPGRGYKHLYVIGFAIEPDARQRIDDYYTKLGLPVTYVQATPDVLMGDLLKNMRSSQIFSVCGQPDVSLMPVEAPADGAGNAQYWQVKLEGLDVFDPATDRVEPTPGREVPAWFLDTDYNGLVFRPRQAFFPLTGAWDNLKRSLRAEFDDSVWAHLAGDTSEPFMGGSNEQIAVKVIDHRGNELMVVKSLAAPKKKR
ncbi:MAG: site-specific DNA-methyltransferase [Piscinibacter sp.]|uniref:site-specific DNA-methyltransferase n=1 Tax=Piscinibacter sp. TaxID=1903157 RepID=UPI0025897962|nr:site-specific DNA-methyltransferase [Piscinibacter sp.]MCW5662918.1 site-specific DNA-methyltransferase [Piscinibacter sp.]